MNNQVNIDHARVSSAPTLNTEYHFTKYLIRSTRTLPAMARLFGISSASSYWCQQCSIHQHLHWCSGNVMQYDTMNQVYYQLNIYLQTFYLHNCVTISYKWSIMKLASLLLCLHISYLLSRNHFKYFHFICAIFAYPSFNPSYAIRGQLWLQQV